MSGFHELKQELFYKHFVALSAIPRGSGNEKAASDYVLAFARERGLEAWRDDMNNVVVKKPASPGCEGAAPVMLQSHLDMVCVKTPQCDHDFLTDPIVPVERDGWITAEKETTLGADNGIAVAYTLAVLEDDTLRHPPIEAVFTTFEEVGLLGMKALDISALKATRMLNIDTAEEHVLCTSCAGGVGLVFTVPLAATAPAPGGVAHRVLLGGLTGGHSGMEIDGEHANSIQLMARLAERLLAAFPAAQLADFGGGEKDNAIPRDAYAVFRLRAEDVQPFRAELDRWTAVLANEYAETEPDMAVRMEPAASAADTVLDADSTRRLLSAVLLMPNGMLHRSLRAQAVDASANVGFAAIEDGKLVLKAMTRSSHNSRMDEVVELTRRLAELVGGEVTVLHGFPAWEYLAGSRLEEQCLRIYRELHGGEEMTVAVVHAGLEPALMAEKRPGMELVSFGPNQIGIHTPQERMEIDSMLRVWSFVVRLLEEMCTE